MIINQSGIRTAFIDSCGDGTQIQRRIRVRGEERHGQDREFLPQLNGPHVDIRATVDTAQLAAMFWFAHKWTASQDCQSPYKCSKAVQVSRI